MSSKERYQNRIELLQGTLDLLQTLLWAPWRGYGISQAIRDEFRGAPVGMDYGSVYPALHRLEKQKWIAVDWKLSENNQRVRVYRQRIKVYPYCCRQKAAFFRAFPLVATVAGHSGDLNPKRQESEI
jgi:PadR family transcriptional regulator PadR